MEEKKYKVEGRLNGIFQVKENISFSHGEVVETMLVYEGSLSDCYAYIRLAESGYM